MQTSMAANAVTTMYEWSDPMDLMSEISMTDRAQTRAYLLRALDKGIDDMEAGRELPLEEAFAKITELRNIRRSAGRNADL